MNINKKEGKRNNHCVRLLAEIYYGYFQSMQGLELQFHPFFSTIICSYLYVNFFSFTRLTLPVTEHFYLPSLYTSRQSLHRVHLLKFCFSARIMSHATISCIKLNKLRYIGGAMKQENRYHKAETWQVRWRRHGEMEAR